MVMEKENFKIFQYLSALKSLHAQYVFWVGFFASCYLAVLPMADTIAFRNLALLGLMLVLSPISLQSMTSIKPPWVFFVWIIYLMVFVWIGQSQRIDWGYFYGQWGRGILAMLMGAGVALVLIQKNLARTWLLALVSSVPIFIHLGLIVCTTLQSGQIPWGNWGRETHHADLGYAACQTVVLAVAAYVTESRRIRAVALALVIACLLSTSIAHSRAGFAFTILASLLVLMTALLASKPSRRIPYLLALGLIFVIGSTILAVAVKHDKRWQTMGSELSAGFYGDAIELQCNGTQTIRDQVIQEFGEDALRILTSIEGGDAARIVVLRAGVRLAIQHPWGWDGSRQSFQKMLLQECPEPKIRMAHTHNGWLDTVLAIGWIGAGLYFALLCSVFVKGVVLLKRSNLVQPWAYVLIALSLYWILRGFTDSIYRDHMLEMQGFLLAFAYVASGGGRGLR
jgi:O-Antigen ligase